MQVKGIVGLLVEVLATPSAEVQRAVAACLPSLMPCIIIVTSHGQSMMRAALS